MAGPPGEENARFAFDAEHWMAALGAVLARPDRQLGAALHCDLYEDGTVRVVDALTRRVALESIPRPSTAPNARFIRDAREARDAEEGAAERWEAGSIDGPGPGSDASAYELFDPDHVRKAHVEEILAELTWVYAESRRLHEVTERVLDLALRLIPSEAGVVLYAGLSLVDVHLAAARGPSAGLAADGALPALHVPISTGVVGLCVREGVSLAISSAQGDALLYDDVARAVGAFPRQIACVPMQIEGLVFGAVVLFNKRDIGPYTVAELSLLAHVARQLASYIHLNM